MDDCSGCFMCQPQVAEVFSVLWRVLEPMLYAFIGAEIDLTVLNFNTVLWGAAVISGALVVSLICIHSSFPLYFNNKLQFNLNNREPWDIEVDIHPIYYMDQLF